MYFLSFVYKCGSLIQGQMFDLRDIKVECSFTHPKLVSRHFWCDTHLIVCRRSRSAAPLSSGVSPGQTEPQGRDPRCAICSWKSHKTLVKSTLNGIFGVCSDRSAICCDPYHLQISSSNCDHNWVITIYLLAARLPFLFNLFVVYLLSFCKDYLDNRRVSK